MSNILVQNIKHTNNTTSMAIDTSGQVTIRGEGSATTTNLQQGLCKMWCQYDGSGTAELDDSFNCSGITDNATGDFTLAIANDMSNDDYAVSGVHGSMNYQFASEGSKTTSSCRMELYNSAANAIDPDLACLLVHGDLA
jgi:hypothetical protein